MTKKLVLVFRPDGHIETEVLGVVGPECDKLTAFLEAELGAVTDYKKKPEHDQRATVSKTITIGK